MSHCTRLLTIVVVFLVIPAAASAQGTPLGRFLPALVASAARIDPSLTAEDHRNHFEVGSVVFTVVPAELNRAMALQLTTFPLNVSWAGFTYGFDSAAGRHARSSSTFGSSFAERAFTAGRRKLGLGFTQQSTAFGAVDGIDLKAADMVFYFEHNDCCPAGRGVPSSRTDLQPEFERDLLEETLSVDLDRDVFAFFADYGVTDRLDVGLSVPIVRVNIDGRITSRILRTATSAAPEIHSFDVLELANRTVYATDGAVGLGDILLRAKYRVLAAARGGVAASIGVRLPTGDADEFLGSGATQTKVLVIWSDEFGRFGPHVNAGYTWSAGRASSELAGATPLDLEVPDEIDLVAGLETGLTSRVSVAVDVVGRRLRDALRFGTSSTVFPSRGPGSLPSAAFIAANNFSIVGRGESLDAVFGVVGTRLNIADTLLLNADLLFPILDNGLTPQVGAVVGFNYVF